jgi:hypothetical protein
LFPSKIFTICGKDISIYPLNIGQIAFVIKKVKNLIPIFQSEQITFDNYSQPDKLITLVSILMESAPEILSEVTGIHQESLAKLPLSNTVEIFSVALEANLESKESLIKNFKRVSETMTQMLPTENVK